MRHWPKMLASLILFAPSVVFVGLFFFFPDSTNECEPVEAGTIEFDRVKIELKDVPAEEKFTFVIVARNTDVRRPARIVSFGKAC
ncbi:hypothetical protein HZA45_02225 [Candidatus Peregrinibacteria bacterium]|nr:hypothetical protein [Candidatus Peregrinibacteria bacterium]